MFSLLPTFLWITWFKCYRIKYDRVLRMWLSLIQQKLVSKNSWQGHLLKLIVLAFYNLIRVSRSNILIIESMDTDASFLALRENFRSRIPVINPPKVKLGSLGKGENLFYLSKIIYTILWLCHQDILLLYVQMSLLLLLLYRLARCFTFLLVFYLLSPCPIN